MAEKTEKLTGSKIKQGLIKNNTYLIFIVLIVVCSVLSPNFLTEMNIRNILLQQSAPIIVAVGMLFVILTGGIDLSVGSIMAVGSSITAVLMRDMGFPMMGAISISLVVGLGLGLITGILVAYGNMQGFVASLAMMTMARGIAFIVTNGTPIKLETGTLDVLASAQFLFPIIIICWVLVVLFWYIQKYTVYGRIVIAIGSNKTAVELAGINVKRHIASVYTLSGLLSVLGGVFIAARASTGSATAGTGQELDAIAACVIGGASLAGGKGFVVKAAIGALVLALIGNIMNLLAVPSYPQDIIKGIIIVAAVLLQVATDKAEKTV